MSGELPATGASTPPASKAVQRNAAIEAAAKESEKAFSQPGYLAFRANTAWKAEFEKAADNAAGFKGDYGTVLRTDTSTPLDHLTLNPRRERLDWADALIDHKDAKADEKLLFGKFVREHPGIEPLGGTWRGGTLVLVYDDHGSVVADFALAYRLTEEIDEDDEPDLPVKEPPKGLRGAVTLVKPLDLVALTLQNDFKSKFVDVKAELRETLTKEVGVQQQLGRAFADSIVQVGKVFTEGKTGIVNPKQPVKDKTLEAFARRADYQASEINDIRASMLDPSLSTDQQALVKKQLDQAEAALGKTVEDGTRYIVANKVETSAGADGDVALTRFTQGLSQISGPEARNTLNTSLTRIETEARQGNALDQANALGRLRKASGLGR
jgi:hypothetical protein